MDKPRHRFFKKRKSERLPRSNVSRHPAAPGHAPAHAAPQGERVYVEGVLQLKGKFGFVLSEDPKVGDVLVQGPSLRLAMGGDRVRARVTSRPEEPRRSGEITDVLIHSRQTVVGTFRRMGNLPVLVPEDEAAMVHLLDLQSLVPHVGDVVTARIRAAATTEKAATGVLTEVLGPRDAPGVDLQSLIRKYELPDAF